MKFLLKTTVKLFIGAALIFVAVYAAAPYLIENLLLRQLEQQGFENVSIRAERPRWNALKLNWLSFESRQGGIKWLLETRDVRVVINPLELFLGNLPTVSTSKTYLKIDSRSRSTNDLVSDFELALPAQWLSFVPLRSFNVGQLVVNWRGQQQSAEYTGTVSVERIADRIQMEMSLARHGSSLEMPYSAALLMTRSGQLSLSIAQQNKNDTPLLSLKARLSDRSDTIEISKAELAFDTLALSEFGRELLLFAPLNAEVSGLITVKPSGYISKKIVAGAPLKYRLRGELLAKLDAVAAPFYTYDASAVLSASFDIDHVSTAMTLDTKSLIETAPPDALLAFSIASAELLPLAVDKPLRIEIAEPLHFKSDRELSDVVDLRRWTLDGVVLVSLPLVGGKSWQLALDSPSLDVSDVVTLSADYELKLPLNKQTFSSGYLGSSGFNATGVLNIRNDQLVVSIDQGSNWSIGETRLGEEKIEQLKLEVNKTVELDYDVSQQRWQLGKAQLKVDIGVFDAGEYVITPGLIKIDIEQALGRAGKWSVNGSLLAEVFASNRILNESLAFYAQAEFRADDEALLGNSRLALNSESNTIANGEFSYDWRKATGGMRWRADAVPVKDGVAALVALIPSVFADGFGLDGGTLDADVSFLLLEEISKAKASVRLSNLEGSYGSLQVNGLSARIVLDDLLALSSKTASVITVEGLDLGFPVRKLRFNVQPLSNKEGFLGFVISDASARLLGGRVALRRMVWLPGQKSQFNVDVNAIDLREILALEQRPELSGSGIIDGRIPITLSGGAISVTAGGLQSRQPGGVISYRHTDANSLAKTHAGLGLALKALEDFRYDSLRAKVDYSPDGELILALSIVGYNPDFENGRQINLNINIEQNVRSLLQSLQLADELTDKIDQRVQQGLK